MINDEPSIDDLLLRLIGDATKAAVMMAELDPHTFAMLVPRLYTFFEIVKSIPRKPTTREIKETVVGFRTGPEEEDDDEEAVAVEPAKPTRRRRKK